MTHVVFQGSYNAVYNTHNAYYAYLCMMQPGSLTIILPLCLFQENANPDRTMVRTCTPVSVQDLEAIVVT